MTTETKTMQKRLTTILLAAAVVLVMPTVTNATPSSRGKAAAGKHKSMIERGRHLVNTSGCHDCHTPFAMGPQGPAPDMTRMLSGHPESLAMPPAPKLPPGPWLAVVSGTNTAWAGPWGTSFTANLTPDEETGIGKWTARDFVATIRTGRHLGRGRALLPPMPVPVYNNMPDEDLAAIFAYLQSIPAIKNRVPQPVPPVTAVSKAP